MPAFRDIHGIHRGSPPATRRSIHYCARLTTPARANIYSPPQEGAYFREWGLGGAMITITGILFIYLVLCFAP